MGRNVYWKEPELEFLREFVPGHTRKEICEEYRRRFPDSKRSDDGIVSKYKYMKLKTGFTGRFDNAYCVGKTRPIGSITLVHGKPYIRTATYRLERLSHIIWRGNGREIPEGYTIESVDGNSENCCLENMRLVTPIERQELIFRRYEGSMNTETFDVTLTMLRLRRILKRIKSGEKIVPDQPEVPKPCPRCGEMLRQGEICLCYNKSRYWEKKNKESV